MDQITNGIRAMKGARARKKNGNRGNIYKYIERERKIERTEWKNIKEMGTKRKNAKMPTTYWAPFTAKIKEIQF